jgi:3-hydroxyacyl-CoA dehydrogenase/enoyl-CoA hydratase/carnithine racemase
MTEYSTIDFTPLLDATVDEVITHSLVRDVPLPGGGMLALITLDNGRDYTRPSTLGPHSLIELGETLDALRGRAAQGEIRAVAVTGTPYIFAAGADLSKVDQLKSRDEALLMAQLGHYTLGKLSTLGVPSFAFVNGLALGGATEIALHCTYRTIDASASAIALPEVFLGLVPGWGGATLLPNLIGIENALQVIISNPLKNNRMLKPLEAKNLGVVDVMFAPANFLEDSIRWASRVLDGAEIVSRPFQPKSLERLFKWNIAVAVAKKTVRERLGTAAKAPFAALDLMLAARDNNEQKGFLREDAAIADLISGDQFRASIYAFDLVQRRAKKPVGAPDPALARPVTKVGVVGAGLMASQFALLFARRLRVPVVITDLDAAHVERALTGIYADVDALFAKGRIGEDDVNQIKSLITGTTDKSEFADCDWVIEAVYEELEVKRAVFAQVEGYVSPECILATNTSSLSVSEIGSELKHPERLVGFHFFNPVAVMPLLEVVKASKTDDASLATAMKVASTLKKTAVITSDRPGFVVNRILAKVMGEAARAFDAGTPIAQVEKAFAPLGLPMGPFELINLVGWKVAAHVQDTMAQAFPERFYASENMHRLAEIANPLELNKYGKVKGLSSRAAAQIHQGKTPASAAEILQRVQLGLAEEIHLMLSEGVVSAPEDIDLCLLLGAGWPFIDGGATPYLDRVGASERAFGSTFHTPQIRGVLKH